MTYKETIDSLLATATSHSFVETVGYGNISDIGVPDNEEPPNYPYIFVNPVDASLDRQAFSVDLNIIAMTQVNDGEAEEITGQSLMIQILSDIISQYTNTTDDPLFDIITPVSITPFKERFMDSVVGATAALTITYGKAINGCVIPF